MFAGEGASYLAGKSGGEGEYEKYSEVKHNWVEDDDIEVVQDSFQRQDNVTTCEDVSNVKPSNVPQDNLPEQAFIPSRDLFGIDDLIFKPSKVHKADILEKANTKPEFPPGFSPLNSNHEATVTEQVANNNPSVQSPKEASNNVFDEGITATKPDNTSFNGSMQDHNVSMVRGSNPANGFSILECFQ
nr:hypothetical protein [Tanacetum cinerariifolium]